MARSSGRQDLFLSIGGTADPLKDAAKAGRTALLELGNAANDISEEVSKALEQMGANAPSAAKQIEQSYRKTFDTIRRNAQAVLAAPNSGAALQIIDAAAAEQAATAAETEAAALRQVATAAANVAQRAGESSAAQRVLAVAAEANAQAAEQEAVALRTQANLLADVRTELGAMGVAQGKATTASAQQRQGVLILGEQVRQFGTEISTGISPVQAFSQQLGQGAFALTLFDGKLGKVGAFLGGPWGIAATVAVTVLTPFVAKLLEGGDALDKQVDKLRKDAEQTDLARRAHAAFSQTIEGEIDAQRRLNEQLDRNIQTERQQQQLALFNAQKSVSNQRASRPGLVSQVNAQQSLVDSYNNELNHPQALNPDSIPGIVAAAAKAKDKLTDLKTQLAKLDQSIADGERGVAEAQAPLIQSDVAAALDGRAAAALRYTKQLALLNDQLAIGAGRSGWVQEMQADGSFQRKQIKGIGTDQYQSELLRIGKERDDAEKAAAAARSNTDPNRQSGRNITLADAEAIVAGIGGRVTSAQRSTAKQAELYARYRAGEGPLAAKPGTSYHERGQALDIAKGGGLTLAQIRKAFTDKGVNIAELLDEGDHFHVAWKKSGPSSDQIARQQQAEEDKRTADAQEYGNMLSSAKQKQAELARQQVSSIAQGADLDAKAVRIERDRLNAAADAGVAQKKWTQAQADAVITLNNQNADLKTSAIRQHEGMQLLDQQLDADRDRIEASNTLLQLQGELATTNSARKQIALRLLANDEQEQRDRAIKLLGSDDVNDQLRGDAIMRDVDAQHPYRVAQINKQFEGPFAEFSDSLPRSAEQVKDTLESIEVRGVQDMEDELAGSVTQALRLKGAVGEVVQELIKLGENKLLSMIFKSTSSAAPLAGIDVSSILSVPFLAGGGRVAGPGGPRDDKVLARLSAGEYVINAAAYAQHPELVEAINNGLPGFAAGGLVAPSRIYMRALPSAASIAPRGVSGTPITFDLRGAVMTEDLLRQMNAISARNSQVAIIGGSQLAQSEIADQRHQAIP